MRFSELFGKKKKAEPAAAPVGGKQTAEPVSLPQAAAPSVAPAPVEVLPAGALLQRAPLAGDAARPAAPPANVRVYDEFGRELMIPLETWRTQLLPGALEKVWDEPDNLYGTIVDALELRLAKDVLAAAEHLQSIDANAERGATLHGIVAMESGDPAAAAAIFEAYLQQHGPSGVVLTNLAKTLQARGDEAGTEAALWRALEADPNQENGLGWYAARQRESGGQAAYVAALERVAQLAEAWRPQVWLARAALDRNDVPAALTLYAQALERAGTPAPTVLLQSMSGDLGRHGDLGQSLALTRPAYDAKLHGLAVGNNLIKAALDLGRLEDARALVDELYALQRPDWAANLHFWEMEIRGKELAREKALTAPAMTAFSIEGPVWLPGNAPARELYKLAAPRRATVFFLGSSVGGMDPAEAFTGQLPDAAGRLSRALPLFLSESAFLHLGLETATIVPWVEGHGFAVTPAPWSNEDAAQYARNGGAAASVVTHVNRAADGVEVTLRVVTPEGEGAAVAAEFMVPFSLEQAGTGAFGLWSRLAGALVRLFGDATEHVPPQRYVLPQDPQRGNYLLRLEQLLAVRCAGTTGAGPQFLSGVREIVRGELDLALSLPASLPLRLILHETLLRLRELRPDIAAEFRGPAELLQRRYPLPDAEANGFLERQLRTAYPPAEAAI